MRTLTIFHQTIAATRDDLWLGWDREGPCLADRTTSEFTPMMPLSVVRDIMADQPNDVRIAIIGDEDVPYLWDHKGIDILVIWEEEDNDVTVFGPTFEGDDGDPTRRLAWRSPRSAWADDLDRWDNHSAEESPPC